PGRPLHAAVRGPAHAGELGTRAHLPARRRRRTVTLGGGKARTGPHRTSWAGHSPPRPTGGRSVTLRPAGTAVSARFRSATRGRSPPTGTPPSDSGRTPRPAPPSIPFAKEASHAHHDLPSAR